MTVGGKASAAVLPPCRLKHSWKQETALNLAHTEVPCSVSSLRLASRALGPEEGTLDPFTYSPSQLSAMVLILSPAQRRRPRCVCWIDLRNCQHISELLVGHENSYMVIWCVPASVVFPSSVSTLANILWEVWPICRKLTAGIQKL